MPASTPAVLPDHLVGGCQCGACRFEISARPLFGYVCHCLNCRKQTSAPFSASILVAADALNATGPIETWLRDDGDAPALEAHFCGRCGVRLFHYDVPRQGIVRVKIGTVDDADWFTPAAEFFTKRRYPWLRFDGNPAQCVERAEDHPALLAAWQELFPG